MHRDKLHIETPYVTEQQTSRTEEYVDAEPGTVETERYGNRKPRRVITRVRISHGKGPNR
jgi:hypothetical protein